MRLLSQKGLPQAEGQIVEFGHAERGQRIDWVKIVAIDEPGQKVLLSRAGDACNFWANAESIGAKFAERTRPHGMTKKEARRLEGMNPALAAPYETVATKAAQLGHDPVLQMQMATYAFHKEGEPANAMLVTDQELDAVLAGLRLLAREVEAGNVKFSEDDGIADIWTCGGDHDGLIPDQIHALADRLREGAK